MTDRRQTESTERESLNAELTCYVCKCGTDWLALVQLDEGREPQWIRQCLECSFRNPLRALEICASRRTLERAVAVLWNNVRWRAHRRSYVALIHHTITQE